jgi:hypothetical protein
MFMNVSYFKHVVSETVLLVVGILLALQINNWNELQKTEKEEMRILDNLLENLKSAKEQSERFIRQEEKLKQSLFLALGQTVNDAGLNLEPISDSIFYELLWNFEGNVPVINSYSDIKNTGKIVVIKNADIRRSFTSLETHINGLKFFIKDRLTVQQLRVDEIAINNINFVRLLNIQDSTFTIDHELPNDYKLILKNQKTRNILATKLELTNKVVRYRRGLSIEINKLILLLKNEIKIRKME